MPPVLATVRIPELDALSKDTIQNSYAFNLPDTSPTTLGNVVGNLQTFYNAFATFLSTVLNPVSVHVRFYDLTAHLDGTPHGPPINDLTFTITALGAAGGVNLPSEVAIVLSTHAATETLAAGDQPIPSDDQAQDEGAPPTHPGLLRAIKRTNGRVYLGPWVSVAAANTAVTNVPRVVASLVSTIATAATALLLAEPGWSVWSRRDAALHQIIGGHVDNRFDSQRKREEIATSRVNFDIGV